MTITSTQNRVHHNGDGSTTAFAFSYFVEDVADLEVWLRDSNNVETLQTIATHYTVSGVNSASVTVTMTTAPASGERLTIVRKEPLTNEVAADNVGTFRSNAFEAQYDRIARGLQRLGDESDRSLKLKTTDLNDATGTFDAGGRAISNLAQASEDTGVVTKAQMDTAIADVTPSNYDFETSGTPSDLIGADGQTAHDPNTGIVYTKSGGTWSQTGSTKGPKGDAATIAVGTVSAGAPGTNPIVNNSGTANNAVFDMTIPRGFDGHFSSNDPVETTIANADKLPFIDASDSNNPKLITRLNLIDALAGGALLRDGTLPMAGDLDFGGYNIIAADNFVGAIAYFAMQTAPTGWLKANGALISRTTYAALFSKVGTAFPFGVGDGSTTFQLPDLRGEFLRAWDDGRGIDPSRAFGSEQLDAFQGHYHSTSGGNYAWTGGGSGGTHFPAGAKPYAAISVGNPTTNNVNGTPRTASETRSRNIALLACIKY